MSETKYILRFYEITSGRLVLETEMLDENVGTNITSTYTSISDGDSGFVAVTNSEGQRVIINASIMKQTVITVEEVK